MFLYKNVLKITISFLVNIHTMKRWYIMILPFVFYPFKTACAQLLTDKSWNNYNLNMEWQKYHYWSKDDILLLRQKYFTDTISVDEMITTFKDNENKCFTMSPYRGYDSIFTYQGNLLNLVRPKARGLPLNRIYMNKYRTKKEAELLTGDLVFLRYPQYYLSFIVSPQPLLETYNRGHIIGREGSLLGYSDFFSSAQIAIGILDGTWHSYITGGTIMLSSLIGKDEPPQPNRQQRVFSVLLYETVNKTDKQSAYTLVLLSPNVDEETVRDFQWMKQFVERLPYGTFMPYYTTDFRILTGRYYRVTVNKCGWLIEDYMDINKKNTKH